MANRTELALIRGARAGDAACQLALGKVYLSGGASLPRNLATALHWLHRAAPVHREAWLLIGREVPLEQARHCLPAVLPWYEKAYAEGVEAAGIVLKQLGVDLNEAPGQGAVAPVAAPLPPAAVAAASSVAASAKNSAKTSADCTPSTDATSATAMASVRAGPAALTAADVSAPAHAAQLERAAESGDREAQLALGLWLARMARDGSRLADGVVTVNFKRAVRWLTLAGEQGLAEAWFALSRIYLKPEFSHRSVAEAQAYLERAAVMGHGDAQRECGLYAWRKRRNEADGDVRALYWLQLAAAQPCAQAQALLARIAPPVVVPAPDPAAMAGQQERQEQQERALQDGNDGEAWLAAFDAATLAQMAVDQPLLAARLALAAAFGLSRAEALLLDVAAADRGHCLVVDIRASYGRSKRRLVLLRTAQERQLLDDVRRRFEQAGSADEGNYRQRLYRLKNCLLRSRFPLQTPSRPARSAAPAGPRRPS